MSLSQTELIFSTLLDQYKADRNAKLLDLKIYTNNPQSIPEHVNFLEYADKLISDISELNDKIETVTDILARAV